jgi:hypothetical protein
MSRRWEQVGRYELKYVIPVSWRNMVVDLIGPFVCSDPHAGDLGDGRVGYRVHSLYFDTQELTDYFERLAEARVRNRVRVRTYDRPDCRPPVVLENKRKSGRMVIKHRCRLCDAEQWLACSNPRPWNPLYRSADGAGRYAGSVFHQLVEGRRRNPVSVVHYEREVFVPRGGSPSGVRLTLDHDIQASITPSAHDLFAAAQVELIPPEWMVMELKFARFAPGWMSALRRELALRAVPVSKFGLSVAKGLRSHRPRELRYLTPKPLLGRWWVA